MILQTTDAPLALDVFARLVANLYRHEPEKAEQAIAMLLAGNSPTKVAKAVGVGKSTIYARIAGEWAPRLVGSGGK